MRFARLAYRFGTWLAWRTGRTAVPVRDLVIDGAAGPLRARLYRPDGLSANAPLVIFFHGGGFCIGDLATHDPVCRDLAVEAQAAVLAIDYRLAPEHPFPAAPDDAQAAVRWAQANAGDLRATGPVIVAGDSAGGNLSAVVALDLRGDPVAGIAGQVLIYPCLGAFAREEVLARAVARRSVLTPRLLRRFADDYLPDRTDRTAARAAPLFAIDHSRLPPALIITAGHDPLREEGIAYAAALEGAGGSVTHQDHPALDHGFIGIRGRTPAYTAAMADIARWIRDVA